ncbi:MULTISPECIES: antibiotic biosynthesis monooxygenase family protein [Pontibacillus]|uniref:Antibiotic biosynthesis monooxygenase n=1 Tax=Pontibacillus chungwhensis TaxID=265426 RepID=A0ABY8V2B9_9BACI|nr:MULTISPECIES: antibiotic biosynthesis monooxygenase [Pontibacillus]MCD5324982.1 antibiotic biosynthesis monooxygenase [Pontibacillus sp. HN14]WIF98939.1 antibiotic biosynthesis monooxygenase [Pontibacillus chungwhensis]
MNVYMTLGTYDYLASLAEKNDQKIFIMQGENSALAYTEGENIFQEPRSYETVDHQGELQEEGFVVMNNIPVTDEGRPLFEDRFKNRAGAIEDSPGFQAIRILRPAEGNTYVVFTQWKDESSFEDWKNSQAFQKAHKNSGPQSKEKPSFSAGPAYLTKYHMTKPD